MVTLPLFPIPDLVKHHSIESISAAVQEFTATAYGAPVYSHSAASKSSVTL